MTPQEHCTELYKAYRNFILPGLPRRDFDTYSKHILLYIKTLIEKQVIKLRSAQVQQSMWVKWMLQINFQGSHDKELVRRMFPYVETEIENPALPKSDFSLNIIMNLNINFHNLVFTWGGFYIKQPSWLALKRVVINLIKQAWQKVF